MMVGWVGFEPRAQVRLLLGVLFHRIIRLIGDLIRWEVNGEVFRIKSFSLFFIILLSFLIWGLSGSIKLVYSIEPTEPHQANAIWIEPSILYLDPESIFIGYKFYLTVWANSTLEVMDWSYKMVYPNVYINASRAAYTAGQKSEFFYNISTAPFPPFFRSYDTTHDYVICCEGRGARDIRSPGYGSLAWVEFEIISLPESESHEIVIDIVSASEGEPQLTYLLYPSETGWASKQPLNAYNSLVRIETPPPNAPPPPPPPSSPPPIPPPPEVEPSESHNGNAMWIEPSTLVIPKYYISPGYKFNVTVWANTSVTTVGWQFWMIYRNTTINATRVAYTAGEKSVFYYYQPTRPVYPAIKPNWNGTHNRIDFAEGAGYQAKREPGYGSLAWVEFEVFDVPSGNATVVSIDIAWAYPEGTYFLEPCDTCQYSNFKRSESDTYNSMVRFVSGEDFLPEFPALVLPFLMLVFALSTLVIRKKHKRNIGL